MNRRIAPWLLPLAILLGWQVASMSGWLSPRVLPEPWAVVKAFATLSASGEMWQHVAKSTTRALSGFAIGGSLALLLGLLTGSLRWAETLLDSTLQMVRNVPPLALIPLVILWFGIDEAAKLFLVRWACSSRSTSTPFTASARWTRGSSRWRAATA